MTPPEPAAPDPPTPELAARPPMGWNSWNCFMDSGFRAEPEKLTAAAVLECAQALVDSGMQAAGYEYVVVDDCWQGARRDGDGRPTADPARFPDGIAALAAQIHVLGLKFGIYSVPGSLTCAQQFDGYGPGLALGSLGHEAIDAATFAEWGVDFLKYDWCAADMNDALKPVEAFTTMGAELAATGRPILYSVSEYGYFEPWLWAPGVAHTWRTTGDLVPTWESVLSTLDRQADLHPYSRPGGWNDPDMLQVGNGRLTPGQNRAHFFLWAVLNAPLIAGNDLRAMSDDVRELLCHPGVIAIDQDWGGRQGSPTRREGDIEIWAKPMSDGGAAAVVLNRGPRPWVVSLDPSDLGLPGEEFAIEDVWTGARLPFGETLLVDVPGEDAVLIRTVPMTPQR